MSWQDEMTSEKQRFRRLWAEHGPDYIYGGWFPIPPPTADVTMDGIDRRLDDMFTRFSAGRLGEVEPILEQLNRSHTTLVEDFRENTDGLLDELDDWTGDAAEGFRHYIREMQSAVDLKIDILLAARQTIEGYQALLDEYRHAINELVRNTDAALDDVREADRDAQYQFAFGVAVAVAGAVTAGVGTGVALAAAAGALTAGVASSATALIGGEEEGAVIVSMVENGEKIVEDAEDAAKRVRNACFEITTFLTTYNGSRPDNDPYGDNTTTDLEEIRPDRPALITDREFDPEEFRPDDAADGEPAGISREDLVLNPEQDDDDPRDRQLHDPRGGQPGPQPPDESQQDSTKPPVRQAPDLYPEQGPEQPEPTESFIPPTT